MDDELSDEIEIKQGVRQGCVLSPLLFKIYSEAIFEQAIFHKHSGIKVNRKFINNLRYADDTIILAGTMADLQRSIDKLNISYSFILITKDQIDIRNNEMKLILNN